MISNCPVFKEDGFSAGLPTGVAYGFYGRQGGVSAPPYESLNCGMGSDDDPADITVNRSIVAQSLGVEAPSLLSLYQTHSADCRPVTALWPSEQRPEGDAFVTDRPGIALGILTADCAPVLFYAVGRNGPVVGAAHAGWRGAFGGVLEATINHMLSYEGVSVDRIHACVGPCIAQRSYEVSDDFYQNFLSQSPDNDVFFVSGQKQGHYLFDLTAYCLHRLRRAGVENVFGLERDTYANEADFFSYRRMNHQKQTEYGRQVSAITILPGS